MPRQTFKLLVIVTVLAVAPAAAGQRVPAARHGSGCPHDPARAAAAAKPGGVSDRGMKIILFERIPSDGSPPLGTGRWSRVFMP